MAEIANIEKLSWDLPDSIGAQRFFSQLHDRHPVEANKLLKNSALLSDILALASFSPLLGTTILQNPSYINWLKRCRTENKIRNKEELLESLARFGLTNSQIEPQVLLARFRRRELLRIYLQDIRGLGTIAEITEEISNLADAILEHALRLAKQELDNRFGFPLEVGEKGRSIQAQFCVVSLGKLGSNELNYSSDIDLLFLYSAEGKTSGHGTRGMTTNREYFIKLAELVNKIVGQQTGEGAAYRVDMRLRPHGRVGALANSIPEAVGYYQKKAQAWERQTLIRSRTSAGNAEVFKNFYRQVEKNVFSVDETVENALENVKRSKEKINIEHATDKGFNVKLGRGGIREIEFIAQALQLAYGGRDAWLRAPHTLISLSRLTDRNLLTDNELSELSDAYDFLRRLEHRLQMEHGLQTHIVPNENEKSLIIAKRMKFFVVAEFDKMLKFHTGNVTQVFTRVFGNLDKNDLWQKPAHRRVSKIFDTKIEKISASTVIENYQTDSPIDILTSPINALRRIYASLEKSDINLELKGKKLLSLEKFCQVSPYFAEILTANPILINDLPDFDAEIIEYDYAKILLSAIKKEKDFAKKLSALRKSWARLQLKIAAFDVYEKIDSSGAKSRQTLLAEASIAVALEITKDEINRIYGEFENLDFAVLALGKLGGRGMDYGSDLDLVLIYDDERSLPVSDLSHAEFYARLVEIFVSTISSFTRDGNLYRVDLRLRPDGKNGATSLSKLSFLNYLQNRSAIWEWLAYVKLRAVAGEMNLAYGVEEKARNIIHENALNADKIELFNETRRVRERLEQKKNRPSNDIDIKFGAGGMLDVYFAIRYFQLRDNVRDEGETRSTLFTLKRLFENGSLDQKNYEMFSEGYKFLGLIDHNLRLTVGRSTSLPLANLNALNIIANRMNLESINDLLAQLTLHRLNIRHAYESVLVTNFFPVD